MNCFDCAAIGESATAVAVCHDCGAAVCADHAVARDHHLTRRVTIARLIVVEPPGRLIRCQVCAAAHDVVAQPSDIRRHGQRPLVAHR